MKTTAIVVVLNLMQITAFGQSKTTTKKLEKMENEKIIAAINAVFNGADSHDWKKIKNVMAENVLLDYTSMSGGNPSSQTPTQIVDAWSSFLPGFDKTKHSLSNFQITTDNEKANVHYLGKADHFIGKEVWTVDGSYDSELQKKGNEWLITIHKFNLEKQSGNINLPQKAIQIINNKKSNIMKTKIQFNSDGLVLVGNLYKPENFDQTKKYPTILVGGSWTTVKEQMSGLYAEELAKQGFITLAIDPRYFGESEGQPRFWENPTAKIADFKNAITFLETVQGVDTNNIFVTAICASSGYMANVAAQDQRIKGLATVAAWLHDGEAVKLIYGGEDGVQSRIKQAQEAKKNFAENGEVVYIPSISTTDTTAAMFGEWDYYLNPNRGAVPQWSADKFAVMSWEDWLTFNPMLTAKNIQIPTIMIHSDGAVLADYVKRFFNDIPHENKILHWTEGIQFDFYDQPKQVTESVTAISIFFKNNLN